MNLEILGSSDESENDGNPEQGSKSQIGSNPIKGMSIALKTFYHIEIDIFEAENLGTHHVEDMNLELLGSSDDSQNGENPGHDLLIDPSPALGTSLADSANITHPSAFLQDNNLCNSLKQQSWLMPLQKILPDLVPDFLNKPNNLGTCCQRHHLQMWPTRVLENRLLLLLK